MSPTIPSLLAEYQELAEASQIEPDELTAAMRKKRDKIGGILRAKPAAVHDGISGFILEFTTGTTRLHRKDLQSLLRMKMRWIQVFGDSIAVGV